MIHLYAIGSPIGQDNLAWLMIGYIEDKLASRHPELSITYFDRPGMQLVNEMSDKQQVILVDTLLSDNQNNIQSLQADDLQQLCFNYSSHGFGVAEALQLSQQLNLLPKTLWILGIPVNSKTPNDVHRQNKLSQQLLQNIERFLKSDQ